MVSAAQLVPLVPGCETRSVANAADKPAPAPAGKPLPTSQTEGRADHHSGQDKLMQ